MNIVDIFHGDNALRLHIQLLVRSPAILMLVVTIVSLKQIIFGHTLKIGISVEIHDSSKEIEFNECVCRTDGNSMSPPQWWPTVGTDARCDAIRVCSVLFCSVSPLFLMPAHDTNYYFGCEHRIVMCCVEHSSHRGHYEPRV